MAFTNPSTQSTGYPVQAADWNLLVTNEIDLNERLTTATSTNGTQNTNISALQTLTGATGATAAGNAALSSRLGPGVTTASTASSQLTALRTRADALESLTGNATYGNSALDSRVGALEASSGVGGSFHGYRQTSNQSVSANTWTRLLLDATDFSTPPGDITISTSNGGTVFTFNRSGLWRVNFVGSMSSGSSAARYLLAVSEDPTGSGDARRVYSEHYHTGNAAQLYSNCISGILAVSEGGTLGCWVWTDVSGRNTNVGNGRLSCSFEWTAPLP